MAVKKESIRFVLDALAWAYRERAFLWGRLEKYTKLDTGGALKFDGDAVKAWIIKWEPSIYEVAKQGFTVSAAIKVILGKAFAPHKMTFEEERAWMDRHGSPG